MQAILSKTQNDMAEIFTMLEDADNTNKNDIENYIVQMGSSVVEALVLGLKNLSGLSRGIAAMSLIRIGSDSIPYLKREAIKNNNSSWVYNYLIQEIECR